jgi:CHAT domain-containing protein
LSGALRRLGDLVYAPLARHLTNVTHLIICPDGQLGRFPFEMMPIGSRFLVEEKIISYVGSGREIFRLARSGSPLSTGKSPQSVGSPLVIGNPDFDFDLAVAGRSVATEDKLKSNQQPHIQSLFASAGTKSRSREYRGIKFKRLPGAEAEARSVAKLIGGDTDLRLGAEARELELKAAQSPRILHLATHGFYLSDQELKQTNSLRDPLMGYLGTPGNAAGSQTPWENPLVRCGIALAGANHAEQITNAIAEDGLLTGLEAARLNLQGTELVILSACDSGSGDIKIGEGVMSLRRAFRIAGAESVLASHWKVSDKATTQLMTEFMRRWRSGEPRAKAWREAQLSLLHSKDYSNPYFWAAFTLTGQWN